MSPKTDMNSLDLQVKSTLNHWTFHSLLFRKWSPLWIRTGTQSVSAVLSAAGRLERKVMSSTSCLGSTHKRELQKGHAYEPTNDAWAIKHTYVFN